MLASAAAAPSAARFVKPGLRSSVIPPARSGKAARAATAAAAWIASPRVRLLSECKKCGLFGQMQRSDGAAPLLMERRYPGGSPGMLRKGGVRTGTKFQVNL